MGSVSYNNSSQIKPRNSVGRNSIKSQKHPPSIKPPPRTSINKPNSSGEKIIVENKISVKKITAEKYKTLGKLGNSKSDTNKSGENDKTPEKSQLSWVKYF